MPRDAKMTVGERNEGVKEALLRVLGVVAVWFAVTVPGAPDWAAADGIWFHAAAGVYLAWANFLLANNAVGTRLAPRLERPALVADLAVIGVLVHLTGGIGRSPFVFLALFEILALAMLRDNRRSLLAACLATAFLGGSTVLSVSGVLPAPAPFSLGGEAIDLRPLDNVVYLLTCAGFASAFVVLAAVWILTVSGRMARRRKDLEKLADKLAGANAIIDDSFRQIEELSASNARLSELLERDPRLSAPPSPMEH